MFLADKLNKGTGSPVDAQFNYVTMLLHGDGTNGAQNNTFLDSSTNNFTITRNGNTTQGSFSPYGSNWSNYFGGSGNYLSMADSTAFNLSGGSYTIECWIYPTGDYGNYNTVVAKRAASSTSTAWELYLRINSGVLSFYNGTNYESSVTPTANAWNHIAGVYDGTYINLYLNGVRVLQSAVSNTNIAASVYIATYPSYDERYIGSISNLRITKGAALYSGTSFTVPTSPLTTTVSAGTVSLLTCQSNRFIDTSVNAATITITGTPSVQRFNPFGASTAYSTSVIGGSGYFDGSGDYLVTPSNSAFNLDADFTVDLWVYFTGNPYGGGVSKEYFQSTTTNGGLAFLITGTQLKVARTGVGDDITVSYTTIANQWYHFAISRSSGTMAVYANGTRLGTASVSSNYPTSALQTVSGNNGYFSDWRIVKGTAIYNPSSSSITVPTSPLTAVSGTSLLLSCTNGAIFDNAMMNDLETVGNAQISTSVKKYGTGSLAFDGTGDWLACTAIPNLILGSGDFTIECWVYISSYTNYGIFCGQWNTTATQAWSFRQSATTGKLSFVFNPGEITATSTASIGTGAWAHVAVTRSGSTFRLFINGTLDGTATSSATITSTSNYFSIGGTGGANPDAMNGYIDDLRITKGYARYTATFTPPTKALSDTGP